LLFPQATGVMPLGLLYFDELVTEIREFIPCYRITCGTDFKQAITDSLATYSSDSSLGGRSGLVNLHVMSINTLNRLVASVMSFI
jgi:hypothetical protein